MAINTTHPLPTQIASSCDTGILTCFWQWANDVSQGLFSVLMLLGFVIAIYLASTRLGTVRAFGFASFVGLIGAIWMAVMKFLPWWIASVFILIGGIGMAVMILSGDKA